MPARRLGLGKGRKKKGGGKTGDSSRQGNANSK